MAKGYNQTQDTDSDETSAAVARLEAFRFYFHILVTKAPNYFKCMSNKKNLYGHLKEEVHVRNLLVSLITNLLTIFLNLTRQCTVISRHIVLTMRLTAYILKYRLIKGVANNILFILDILILLIYIDDITFGALMRIFAISLRN